MPAVTVIAFILICCRVRGDVIIKDEPATFTAVASDQYGNQVPVTGKLDTIQIFDIRPANETDDGDFGLKIDVNVSPLSESDVSQTPESTPASSQQSPTVGNTGDLQSELVSESIPQPVSFPPTASPASSIPSQTSSSDQPSDIPLSQNTNQFEFPSTPSTNTEPTPTSPVVPISSPGGQLDSPIPPPPLQPDDSVDYGSSYGPPLINPGVDYSNSSSENQTSDMINATSVDEINVPTPTAISENSPDFSTTNPYDDANNVASLTGENVNDVSPFPADNSQPINVSNPPPQLGNADLLTPPGFPSSNAEYKNVPTPFLSQSANPSAFSLPNLQNNFTPPFNPYQEKSYQRLPAPLFGGKPTRTSGPNPDDIYYLDNDASDDGSAASRSNETETAPWYLPFLTILEDLLEPGDVTSAEVDEVDYYDLPINDTEDTTDGDNEIDPTIWYEYFHPETWNNFTNVIDFDSTDGQSKGQMGPDFPVNAMGGAWNKFRTWPNLDTQRLNLSSFGKTPTAEYASFSFSQFGNNPPTWSVNYTKPEFVQIFEESSSPFNVADIVRNTSVLEPTLFLTEAPTSSYNVSADSEVPELDIPSPGANVAELRESIQKIIKKLGVSAEPSSFDLNSLPNVAPSNYANNQREPEMLDVNVDTPPNQPKNTSVDANDDWYQSDYPSDEINEIAISARPSEYANFDSEPEEGIGEYADGAETISRREASSDATIAVERSSSLLVLSVTASVIGRAVFDCWI